MNDLKKIIYCCIIILSPVLCVAQKSNSSNFSFVDTALLAANKQNKVCIKDLTVTGTKQTKVYIVYREIQFKKGDSIVIADLYKELEQARFQVYNTTLFNEVKFELVVLDAANVHINVQVLERWYLFPFPHFKLIDRNFNEWYKTYHHSLSRVDYGIKFTHYNLSGRRDQLRIYLINGYTKNVSFSYTAPYSNKKLTEGFTIGGGYLQKREMAIRTDYKDSLLFYPSDSITKAKADFVYKSWYAVLGYTIRKGFFKKHSFSASYSYVKIADSVIIDKRYNRNYFKDSVTSKGIFELNYKLQYNNVDNGTYPLKGKTAYVSFIKRGLGFTSGINMFMAEAGWNMYYELGKNWYGSIQFIGNIKLPFDQAYINQRALGYGENYLRGLEYYVIDGVATALIKSTIKKKLFSINIPFKYFPKLLTKIPITVFAKTYTDVGYAYTLKKYDTYLNNRLLYSGGFGIDIITVYDFNLKFEYSFNQLGKKGLFLHNQSGF
jgi:hypothetical protein